MLTAAPSIRRMPTVAGGGYPTLSYGRFGLSAAPVNVLTGGVVDTKGAWASLGTLSQPVDTLYLNLNQSGSRQIVFDIEANGQQVVFDFPIINNGYLVHQALPIRLPAGLVRARTAGSQANLGFNFSAFGGAASITNPATIIEPIGPTLSVKTVQTVGVTISPVPTSAPAWVQVNAAGIANAVKGIVPFIGQETKGGGRTNNTYTLEIGTGPDSANVTALDLAWLFNFNTISLLGDQADWLDQAFPAGTIFWVRVTASAANTDPVNVQLMSKR